MRPEKQLLLDEVLDDISSSKALIFTKYSALKANELASLRKALYQNGGDIHIIKKTLLVKAAAQVGFELSIKDLDGHVAIVYAKSDAINATKALCEVVKESNDKLTLLAGYFDNKLCSAADVVKISQLPTLPEMRAQMLATLEAPMSQTLAVMEALLTSVMHAMQNRADKMGE